MKFIKLIKASNTQEKEALAQFLETTPNKIEEIEPNYGLPTFKFGKEEYCVSNDDGKIKQAVSDSLENLFEGMYVSEFCEKVIPYLGGSVEDYLEPLDDDFSIEEQLSNGMLDTMGYEFEGYANFDEMAQDVIDSYGAGHEIAPYDNRTEEIDFNGSTYYIFRQN